MYMSHIHTHTHTHAGKKIMIEEEAVEVLQIGVSTAKCTKLVVSARVCMCVSRGV